MRAYRNQYGHTIVPSGRGKERVVIVPDPASDDLVIIQTYGERSGLKATCGIEIDTLRQALLLSGIATRGNRCH